MIKTIIFITCILNILCESYPVAIFHGMGDQCSNSGMNSFTQYIGNKVNVYAKCIEIGNGAVDSISMKFDTQAHLACESLKNDPNFKGQSISVMGLSQGALIARSIIQRCDFQGQVKRFISIGGPQNGVASIPRCNIPVICSPLNWVVEEFIYTDFVQNNIGPAGYFRNPINFNKYVQYSTFLSDLNNQKDQKNVTYKTNIQQLEKMVLVMFTEDTMVIPKESEHFGFYQNDGKTVQNITETNEYNINLLGLKDLNEAGKIQFVQIKGNHLQFENSDIDKYFIPALQ